MAILHPILILNLYQLTAFIFIKQNNKKQNKKLYKYCLRTDISQRSDFATRKTFFYLYR